MVSTQRINNQTKGLGKQSKSEDDYEFIIPKKITPQN
jgi:hypothetical protein